MACKRTWRRSRGFPEAALDLIYPYWRYLGLPVNRLAFTIWALACPLWEHIEEIEIAAPPTFARYTGAFKGTIYAYEQDPWDSVVARALSISQERFIRGLDFVGGAAPMGCGYESTILSGRTAAQRILARLKRKE